MKVKVDIKDQYPYHVASTAYIVRSLPKDTPSEYIVDNAIDSLLLRKSIDFIIRKVPFVVIVGSLEKKSLRITDVDVDGFSKHGGEYLLQDVTLYVSSVMEDIFSDSENYGDFIRNFRKNSNENAQLEFSINPYKSVYGKEYWIHVTLKNNRKYST